MWPFAETLASSEQARRTLSLIERRAIADTSPAGLSTWLERLTAAADVHAESWWAPQLFSPVDAFTETVERRALYARTVAEMRLQNKSITPLEWAHDLPENLAIETVTDLRRLSGIGHPAGSPVVSDALLTARLLRWVVAIWAETEQVKNRRRYVRDAHGAPEGLPLSWLTAVTSANATRLPL